MKSKCFVSNMLDTNELHICTKNFFQFPMRLAHMKDRVEYIQHLRKLDENYFLNIRDCLKTKMSLE